MDFSDYLLKKENKGITIKRGRGRVAIRQKVNLDLTMGGIEWRRRRRSKSHSRRQPPLPRSLSGKALKHPPSRRRQALEEHSGGMPNQGAKSDAICVTRAWLHSAKSLTVRTHCF